MGLFLKRKVNEKVTLIVPPSSEEQKVELNVDKISFGRKEATISFNCDRSVKILRNELLNGGETKEQSNVGESATAA